MIMYFNIIVTKWMLQILGFGQKRFLKSEWAVCQPQRSLQHSTIINQYFIHNMICNTKETAINFSCANAEHKRQQR